MENTRNGNQQLCINILSQYFYPDIASTGQLLTELAEDLAAQGSEVRVCSGYPSYANHLKAPHKEEYKGIFITRIPATHLEKNSRLGRILNSLSFFISAFFHVLFYNKDQLLFIVSNPPFMGLIGLIMKKLRGKKYVFLIHDVYPDVAVRLGYLRRNGITARIWEWMNRLIFRSADRLIVLGEDMAKVIKEKAHPFGEGRIAVIHNWCDGEFIKPFSKTDNWFVKEHDLLGKTVVLYSGNIGMFQDLEIIVEAAERLKGTSMLFLFIGEGGKKEKLIELAASKNLANVKFLPYQKKEDLPYSLTCSDISLVTLEKGMEGLGVPSKLYGILASGRAVIAIVSEHCDVADILKEAQCGYVIDQEHLDEFVEKLQFLHENPDQRAAMGARARTYFEAHFRRDLITRKYFELIQEVCSEKTNTN